MKKQLDFMVHYEVELQGWQRCSSGKFTIRAITSNYPPLPTTPPCFSQIFFWRKFWKFSIIFELFDQIFYTPTTKHDISSRSLYVLVFWREVVKSFCFSTKNNSKKWSSCKEYPLCFFLKKNSKNERYFLCFLIKKQQKLTIL